MNFKCFGAFLPAQIIPKLICGNGFPVDANAVQSRACAGERTLRPEPNAQISGYTSGGSFPKSVRCLPVAFILFASFLISACGSSDSDSGGGSNNPDVVSDVTKKNIKSYALEYKGGSYHNKDKHEIYPDKKDIPEDSEAKYAVIMIPATTQITNDKTNGKISIAKDTKVGNYTLKVVATANNAKYTGVKYSSEFVVTINGFREDINKYGLSYGTGTIRIKTGGELVLTTNIPKGAQVTYSFEGTKPADVSIDNKTGKISLSETIKDGPYNFVVLAAVPTANFYFEGTKRIPINIEVVSAASYKPDPTQVTSKDFFTVGDIDSPALIALNDVSNDASVTAPKIEIKVKDSSVDLYAGNASKATYGGKVTLGIPTGGFSHTKFKDIANDTTIVITVNAKVAGGAISKIFTKIKKPKTDIYSWRDLDKVREDRAANYTLKNNIPFPENNTYGYETTFNPLGTFTGIFDGAGKTISGLEITGTSEENRGLFAIVSGNTAEIKNLVIHHKGISGLNNVGAVAGKINNEAKITNVGMKSTPGAEVFGKDNNVGGLVGEASNGTVTGYATGTIKGTDEIGGLVGLATNSTVIGYSTGEVISNSGSRCGGLVGKADKSTVTGYTTGKIGGNSAQTVGGLVGLATNNSRITGYATGAISGKNFVGGLVGFVSANVMVKVTGYARSSITKTSPGNTETDFGLLVGLGNANDLIGYHSSTESQFIGITKTVATGENANDISVDNNITKSNFGKFTFDTAIGNWTFISGKWPAINLPVSVGGDYSTDAQPTDP